MVSSQVTCIALSMKKIMIFVFVVKTSNSKVMWRKEPINRTVLVEKNALGKVGYGDKGS